ncbi:hypothetical protein ACTFG9_01510, partial [Campylobacter jejuni]
RRGRLADGFELTAYLSSAYRAIVDAGMLSYTRLKLLQRGRHMAFEGSSTYVVTQALRLAVDAAITLERPLL